MMKNQVNPSQKHSSDQAVSSPLDALSEGLVGRELDFAVAERVMGARACRCRRFVLNETKFPSECLGCGNQLVPHYSALIAAAMEVEDRIAQLGLQNDYIAALWTNRDRSVNFWTRTNMESLWAAIHATPEQRCRAALAAVNGTANKRDSSR